MTEYKRELAAFLESHAGINACRTIKKGNGWPAHILVKTSLGWVAVAAYLALITGSYRRRDRVELRFQNPAQDRPILDAKGELLALFGLEDRGEQWVIAAMDARRRIGRIKRNSYFVRLQALDEASTTGWAAYLSGSKEPIVVFAPVLLPIYIEGLKAAMWPPAAEIRRIAQASGMLEADGSRRDIERGLRAVRRLKPEPIRAEPRKLRIRQRGPREQHQNLL